MKSSNKRSQSLLLSAVAIATLPIQECSAGSGYDAERFSSSIVTHHNEDLALGAPLSQQQQQSPQQHVDVSRKLRIHRSMIDRDPIYFDDEGQGQIITSDGSLDFDVDEDPLSIVHQHQHTQHQHQIMNHWQSPLESCAPLPSLSLEPNPSTTGTATISTITSPISISPGYHHSHEIDFTKQYQQQQQEKRPLKLKTRKTGTTITALLAQNSTVLILAADTRATDGSTVADKRCEKLHVLASNVWCAGAGTSADVEALVRRVKFTFWKRGVLQREGYGSGIGNSATNININLDTNNNCDASTATAGTNLLENKEDRDVPSASIPAILHYIRTQLQKTRGNLGVNLLAGGYDYNSHRAHLAAIHPHGSMDIVTYAALGSGGLAATGVLESRYPKLGNNGCTVEEGIRLAVDAVRAGIDNDLGSGSQVDVCVIGQEGVLYRRAVIREEELEWVSIDGDAATSSREVIGNGEEEQQQQFGSSIGVNGFGNVPFAIQSKKLVSEKQIEVERERMKWLDRVVSGEE